MSQAEAKSQRYALKQRAQILLKTYQKGFQKERNELSCIYHDHLDVCSVNGMMVMMDGGTR